MSRSGRPHSEAQLTMNPPPTDPVEQRRLLSALADGEADSADAAAASALWAQDPAARAHWHLVQWVGDVMRSDELAHRPQRDAQLLAALRQRLQAEPVPLAPLPEPLPETPRRARSWRWLAPTAVAAGFAAVAGMLVLTRDEAPGLGAQAPVMAAVPPAGSGLRQAGGLAGPPRSSVLPSDLKMVRDARLDSYLRAHREEQGGASVAIPGGALRSVETLVPQR